MKQDIEKRAYQSPNVVVNFMNVDDVVRTSTVITNGDYVTNEGNDWGTNVWGGNA